MPSQIDRELAKVITKCLLDEGYQLNAIKYVLSNYDLTSYLLDDALKIMGEQCADVSQAMAI